MASTSTPGNCGICNDPLLIPISPTESIPDDVQLQCSHHFHWTCLMEHCATPQNQTTCPSCNQTTLTPSGEYLVTIHNEGGHLPHFNLGEEIARESFLSTNPEARRIEIFLGLMAQGEHDEAELFLRGEDNAVNDDDDDDNDIDIDGDEDMDNHVSSSEGKGKWKGKGNAEEETKPLSPDVVFEGGNTAMHVAALNDDVEGVRLLLRYGADKGLRTEDGRTALDLARSQGAERVVALLS